MTVKSYLHCTCGHITEFDRARLKADPECEQCGSPSGQYDTEGEPLNTESINDR